ncbi:MAG: rod shape-determining protein MreC [Chitinophagaceae bacterium]|nr:MAG: rod shape-determining protein MreC [Chitinophagaceae bacterium]
MRNIFLFLRRYSTFFIFLVLQVIALVMLFRYNNYQRAIFLGKATEITGFFNSKYNKAEDFFHLRNENIRVHQMNDSLRNLLYSNFIIPDSDATIVVDTIKYDTTGKVRRYISRAAQVVNNSVNEEKNYIQLNRGSLQGIADNMSVINSDGTVVGVVVNVSDNFSQVMSLLHVQSRVNAMLKKSRNNGRVEWDGKHPFFLTVKDIPKSDNVTLGDSVVTGLYSYNFPPGLLIGTVAEIINEKSTNFYSLKIRTSTNFQNLQQVFVIENLQRSEQVELNKATHKKIDEINKRKN